MKVSYLSGMNVSASGLMAQRKQMNVAAENLANIHTTRTESGDPYRRKMVSFATEPIEFPAPDGKETERTDQLSIARTHIDHMGKASALGPAAQDAVNGVRSVVGEDSTDFSTIYDPGHPDADADGNVRMPNVDMAQEMVTLMAAARAYEANVAALGTSRAIAQAGLDLIG